LTVSEAPILLSDFPVAVKNFFSFLSATISFRGWCIRKTTCEHSAFRTARRVICSPCCRQERFSLLVDRRATRTAAPPLVLRHLQSVKASVTPKGETLRGASARTCRATHRSCRTAA
jgi:hypothetical protein